MIIYVHLDDALKVIRRFGFHLKDAGLLSSALARPATSLYDRDVYPTLSLKAAALLESCIRNHALLDGNKRTGWVLMQLFLWLNDQQLILTEDVAFELVVGMAAGSTSLEQADRIIAGHIAPLA